MGRQISINCPSAGANVGTTFTVRGSVNESIANTHAVCTLKIPNVNEPLSQMAAISQQAWHTRFSLPVAPQAGATLTLTATWFDQGNQPIGPPDTKTLTFQPGTNDPCPS